MNGGILLQDSYYSGTGKTDSGHSWVTGRHSKMTAEQLSDHSSAASGSASTGGLTLLQQLSDHSSATVVARPPERRLLGKQWDGTLTPDD